MTIKRPDTMPGSFEEITAVLRDLEALKLKEDLLDLTTSNYGILTFIKVGITIYIPVVLVNL